MRIFVAVLATTALLGSSAHASDKCSVPMNDWQPREALKTKLEGEGWKVRSIKTEDGCYEAYAIDAKGKKVEAYFNPKTFEAVSTKSGD
ncbi:PepSY domain-containing protein [Rhizobium sp. SL86]|uniref:PepSY domain-containing protein n=1 Tax=Rhizobium sp. SL86 TaxID=2995148 RepID=UPI0022761B15|nr:PepSY domain-containing protein [Rhizobium sp. SL86]MCY1668928.1 PepSY domain-containing protein [Rhizobium sp. SL86]